MKSEVKTSIDIPYISVIETKGLYWADNWMTQELKLSCESLENLSQLDISFWNPDFSTRFAGNIVTVICNEEEWHTEPLMMGECANMNIPIDVLEGDNLEISIKSAIAMQGDALDARERSVILISIKAAIA